MIYDCGTSCASPLLFQYKNTIEKSVWTALCSRWSNAALESEFQFIIIIIIIIIIITTTTTTI